MNIKLGIAIATVIVSVLIAALAITFTHTNFDQIISDVPTIDSLLNKKSKQKHPPRPILFAFKDLGGKGFAKGRLVEVFCIDGYKYVAMTRFGSGVSLGLVQAREVRDGQEVVASCNHE